MNNVMDAFYWRSAIIAILVVLAVAGAMLLRLFRAWWRRMTAFHVVAGLAKPRFSFDLVRALPGAAYGEQPPQMLRSERKSSWMSPFSC